MCSEAAYRGKIKKRGEEALDLKKSSHGRTREDTEKSEGNFRGIRGDPPRSVAIRGAPWCSMVLRGVP
jgi:hypothetical protein